MQMQMLDETRSGNAVGMAWHGLASPDSLVRILLGRLEAIRRIDARLALVVVRSWRGPRRRRGRQVMTQIGPLTTGDWRLATGGLPCGEVATSCCPSWSLIPVVAGCPAPELRVVTVGILLHTDVLAHTSSSIPSAGCSPWPRPCIHPIPRDDRSVSVLVRRIRLFRLTAGPPSAAH